MRLIRGLISLAVFAGIFWAAWWLAWQVGSSHGVPPPPWIEKLP
jgi:hypothetical protein